MMQIIILIRIMIHVVHGHPVISQLKAIVLIKCMKLLHLGEQGTLLQKEDVGKILNRNL